MLEDPTRYGGSQYTAQTINEREIGIIITKLEYLKDDVASMGIEISNSLLERKDIEYKLENITDLFDRLHQHIEKINKRIEDINEKVKKTDVKITDHIDHELNVFDEISNKFGKWFLGIVLASGGAILYQIFMRIVKPLWLD